MMKTWIKRSFILGMSIGLLVPSLSYAFGEAAVIQTYVGGNSLIPMIKPSWGNFVLHTETLNKFYTQRGYQAVWVDSTGFPNAMSKSLRTTLLSADRHGLNPADYWDADVENLYKAALANQKNWITFELAASEAMIRYASHMSTGRFDPSQIDDDIKFKQKEFKGYTELNGAVSYGASSLGPSLDSFAPNHPRYAGLMEMLQHLKNLKASDSWETLKSPGFALKVGVKDPIISKLRIRLNSMGYIVSMAGGDTFEGEFDKALRLYQANNGLGVDGVIGTSSEVLRSLNYSLGQRISQVEVTMEKLRWLPANVEQRHIFVNLATAEFRLFDESGMPFEFRSIAGQAFRRTPSMRDSITFVNLNPYWTVPRSIAIRDKLEVIKKDPSYLSRNNMVLVDEFTDRIVDPATINWRYITAKEFTYYIRQNPGMNNALGVVKFPLQNPWAIYMHDTNEKALFAESKRLRSSGCVRLEKPLELAAYLLRDQAGWDYNAIRSYVPQFGNFIPGELDKKIFLKKPMPVYFLYLTAEKANDGTFRFVEDVYGQDSRVSRAIQNKKTAGEIF